MKHEFNIEEFPNAVFEIETSGISGKSTLRMNGNALEQLKEKGKPFLIPKADGTFVKAFPKPAFPDPIPTLIIDEKKYMIVEKLKWYQYVIGGIPLLLLFVGGLVGGALGGISTYLNYSIFRQGGSESSKYLKVFGVIIASFSLYFFIVTLLLDMIS